MNLLTEILVIWRAELGRALRSGRVVALLVLYGLFSALVLLTVGWMTRSAREQLAQQAGDAETAQRMAESARQSLLGFFVGFDPAVVEALQQVPLVVVVVFKLALFFLPLYVVLMGFDQVSGELGPRSLRYLVVRARRASVLGGKFLAQGTLLLVLVLLVDLAVIVYALATEPDLSAGVALTTLGRVWLATSIFALAYVALTTLCSTAFGTPGLSLVGNFVVLFGFWFLNLVGTASHASAQMRGEPPPLPALLRFATPSHYATDLLHPGAGAFALSVLAYAAFTAVFLVLAQLLLKARDV
ncbi:MAG: ABC transporter permease [Myxococcaceae bacterium]|nr:ABC transporter permease [Myxococcaceae bacterium]MCI0673426.1 ABC transporter permease [Myxococcaceae bacterium]